MSRLTVYEDDAPGVAVVRTEGVGEIASALAGIGVRFERWNLPTALTPEDSAEDILAAYRPHLDRLMGAGGAGLGGRHEDERGGARPIRRSGRNSSMSIPIPRMRCVSSCTAQGISCCMSMGVSTMRCARRAT